MRDPIGTRPLREIVKCGDRLAAMIADLTQPLPSDRLLPLAVRRAGARPRESDHDRQRTGSHRTNTPEELASIVGAEVLRRYRVVNQTAHDLSTMLPVRKSADGETVYLDRAYVEPDRRIVLGFVEPHFMAGFSGGYKGIFPAVAYIASIMGTTTRGRSGTRAARGGSSRGTRRRRSSATRLPPPARLLRERDPEPPPRDHAHLLRPPDRRTRGGRPLLEADGQVAARGRSPSWSLSPAVASRSAPPAS